jgi:transposase
MVKQQVVEEILAELTRGASVRGLARIYDVDRKTIRNWRARGSYRPRRSRPSKSILDPYATWLTARAPEVEYNAAVLTRELRAQGYTGSAQQVYRFVRPLRVAAARGAAATVRFETPPGQQAQVDFGQRRLWIGDCYVATHLFVFTLGYSRRLYSTAFPHERLDAVLVGHEQAFRHFGGVPREIVVDNAKPVVLHHGRESLVWHPIYADFAGYYGFRPWAHWPYRPQTKGKTESGVKYVKRNALAGKRFGSWEHLNGWLLEWTTTVADTRLHGTTHETPLARFAREQLTPLGSRPAYHRERLRHRVVPNDALVAIAGSRYSVPVCYVGATVTIRELASGYEILHGETVIARHPRLARHQVALQPEHYAGLLRPSGLTRPPAPPRFDPDYPAAGQVSVRDLAVYAAIAEGGAA